MRQLFLAILMFISLSVEAITVRDTESGDFHKLFVYEKTKYVIQYAHQFTDTLKLPYGCELKFEGGCLKGPIVFNDTKLCGNVNLKGSVLSGTIRNTKFDASWLCSMDGVTDDAPKINEIIEICGNIYFPKGNYRLISAYEANEKVGKECLGGIKAHIGICKDNVVLSGEKGTVFITDKPLGTICVFSLPNQIANSIRNVKIENISFNVHNDGKNFYEFMHTIKLIGVNGITINNCTFSDFWGDAICLSHYGDTPKTGERTRNQNVKILDNTIIGGDHHNNRNGISVINGKNVLIKGNTIKNTSRQDMPGGIDVEPNNSAYTIENIRIENNMFKEIRGSGGAICIVTFNDGPAHNVSILNNKIYNSNNGILLYVKTEGTTEGFLVKGNYVDRNTNPYRFTGSGASKDWTISGNTFDRPCKQNIPGEIKIANLTVKKNKKKV